jgi:hypothetical protein
MEEQIIRNITEDADSLEIGTPGKNGAIKIHCDFNKFDECIKKLDSAKRVRDYANTLIVKD